MEDNIRTNSTNKREQKTYIDYEIFKGKVRLVRNGEAPIVIERDDAIELAHSQGMNLIQIAYNKNDFPHAICKMLDYGKFKYEQKQKEKNAKKAAKAAAGEIKEVYFSIRIDDGDKNTKIRHIQEFLKEKNTKVKVSIRLVGREKQTMQEMAKNLLREIVSNFETKAMLDGNITYTNGVLSCILKAIK